MRGGEPVGGRGQRAAAGSRRLRILVGVTGASGAPYAVALLRRHLGEVYLALSQWGRMVMKEETGLDETELRPLVTRIFSDKDLANPLASGSNPFDAMVVVPCSLTTMAKIANGIGDTLITRAAMVALKERRRLVLVVREAPWPTNAFENAARLSRDGVIVIPASPPFYHRPETLEELVEQFVDKVVGVLGMEARRKWRSELLAAGGSQREGEGEGQGGRGGEGEREGEGEGEGEDNEAADPEGGL